MTKIESLQEVLHVIKKNNHEFTLSFEQMWALSKGEYHHFTINKLLKNYYHLQIISNLNEVENE